MQDKILHILTDQDDVTWQDIIYGLIRSDEMNPWDVDISLLTKRYLETVRQLKDTNFHLSGKVLLAAALLVKIKSERLVNQDIAYFDSILYPNTDLEDNDLDMDFIERPQADVPPLGIKSPQARKRRVTVQDLIGALERALRVNKRRILRNNRFLRDDIPDIPEKKINISALISTLFERILGFFRKKEEVTFSKLLPEDNPGREEKILTLLPLLHLDSQSKIELDQPEHFGEIFIREKGFSREDKPDE